MNTELLNNVANVFKPAVETVRALNRLNVATVEKVVNVQLASAQASAELAIANLKAALEVTDLDSAKAYANNQNQVAKIVYERFAADGNTLGGIAKEYGVEAGKLVREAVPAVAPKAKKAA